MIDVDVEEVKVVQPVTHLTKTGIASKNDTSRCDSYIRFLPYVVIAVLNVCALIWLFNVPIGLFTSYDKNNHRLRLFSANVNHKHNHIKPSAHVQYAHQDLERLRLHDGHSYKKCSNISTRFENLLQINSPVDQDILTYIKCYHLSPPVPKYTTRAPLESIKFKDKYKDKDLRKIHLEKIFGGKTGGFFIESQPSGHERPYTLSLERNANWTGLVLETNPIKLLQLVSLFQNSWISNACLSSSSKGSPSTITKGNILLSKCYSLVSYLSLLNRTSVDLLSLGGEKEPWKIIRSTFMHRPSIYFGVIDISHNKLHPADKGLLKDFLKSRNYRTLVETPSNFIFQHKSQSQRQRQHQNQRESGNVLVQLRQREREREHELDDQNQRTQLLKAVQNILSKITM